MNDLALKASHICENAFFSSDGKLNIIAIFDRIYVINLPAIHYIMDLAMVFEGKPNAKEKVKLNAISPSGEKILPDKDIEINLSDTGKFNFVMKVPSITLKEEGIYKFLASSNGKPLGEATFEVSKGGSNAKGSSNSN